MKLSGKYDLNWKNLLQKSNEDILKYLLDVKNFKTYFWLFDYYDNELYNYIIEHTETSYSTLLRNNSTENDKN